MTWLYHTTTPPIEYLLCLPRGPVSQELRRINHCPWLFVPRGAASAEVTTIVCGPEAYRHAGTAGQSTRRAGALFHRCQQLTVPAPSHLNSRNPMASAKPYLKKTVPESGGLCCMKQELSSPASLSTLLAVMCQPPSLGDGPKQFNSSLKKDRVQAFAHRLTSRER